jgi:hypothetical protein
MQSEEYANYLLLAYPAVYIQTFNFKYGKSYSYKLFT